MQLNQSSNEYKGKFTEYFVKEIKDPIWRVIPITELEERIIKSPVFSRLLEINQMGVAWTTFPGAIHKRFHHCLGVMHLADYFLRNISYQRKKKESNNGEYEIKPLICYPDVINERVWQCFRIAALCHDIGHPPLSHVIEEGLRKNPKIIPTIDPKVIETITDDDKKLQYEFINKISGKNKYSHEIATQFKLRQGDLNSLIEKDIGKTGVEQLPKLAIGEADEFPYSLLNPIINSDLDVDKLDYLKRDGYFCAFHTTYEISDFENAIIYKVKNETQKDCNPIILINKDKIGAVNAFLYSRYREIDEVHHDGEVRKATQVVIDHLVQKIKSFKTIDEKINYINNLHFSFGDFEFWDSFNGTIFFDTMQNIRRCKTDDYKEILPIFNIAKKSFLDFENLTPLERINTHTILCDPPSISRLQEKIRKKYNNERLIIDIRTAKPPQFSIYINFRNEIDIPLFHVSEASKGILRDSISNLYIYFYEPIGTETNVLVNEVKAEINKIAHQAIQEHFENNNSIWGHILICILISSIFRHAVKELKINDPWLYSQFYLQEMIERICLAVGISSPYKNYTSDRAHPGFVRDIETLIVMGLLIEKTRIVNIPNKNSKNSTGDKVDFLNITRDYYSLSIYGEEYVKQLKNCKDTNIYKKYLEIEKEVWKIQDSCKEQILIHYKKEKEMQDHRLTLDPKMIDIQDERKKLSDEIHAKGACILSF